MHGWVRERGVLGVGAGAVPKVGSGRGRAVAWEGQGPGVVVTLMVFPLASLLRDKVKKLIRFLRV